MKLSWLKLKKVFETSLKKNENEDLKKAPVISDDYENMNWPEHPVDEGKYVKTITHKETSTPVHVIHRFERDEEPDLHTGSIYYITENGKHDGNPIARTEIGHLNQETGDEFDPHFKAALTNPDHRGKGLNTILHLAALKDYKNLKSDYRLSPGSQKTYEKLAQHPNVKAKLMPTNRNIQQKIGNITVTAFPQDTQHEIKWKPTKKLAASEDLKKAPVEYIPDPQETHKKIPKLNDSYKIINKVTLPNGLIYQQHEKSDYMGPVHVHHLYHPNEGNPVAEVITRPDEDSPMNHFVHYSQVSPDHKGKGLGKQAYLAALVHGKNVGRLISDKSLSQNAHKAWVGFKGVKGLGGRIGKYATEKEGTAGNTGKYNIAAEDTHQVFVKNKKDLDHNAMFPPVSGVGEKMAASEGDSDLKKSIHPNDFKKIKASHDKGASMAVDALSHIAKHPAHENFLNHIVNPAESVKARKIARGSMGVASKMIHDAKSYKDQEGNKVTLAQPATYMTKPYFGHMESSTKTYTKTPTKGWATLATKDLLHAADMGHMAEDVQAHVLNGVPVTVHKFSETHEPHVNDYQKIHPLDAQKIAVMDFLTGNNDRHSGNIMVSKEQVTDPVWGHTTNSPLLIDHERNFQYHRTQQNKFGGIDHSSTDTPANFYHNSFGVRNLLSKDAVQHPEEYADDLHHWWNESAPKVKEAFNQNIQHIKDPVLRSHIERNFNQRIAHLDEHLINGNYYDMFRRKNDKNYNPVPVIEGVKPMAMPKVKVRSA